MNKDLEKIKDITKEREYYVKLGKFYLGNLSVDRSNYETQFIKEIEMFTDPKEMYAPLIIKDIDYVDEMLSNILEILPYTLTYELIENGDNND